MGEFVKATIVVLWVLSLSATSTAAATRSRSFHGPYLGVEIANEDFIGGSFVDGMDLLAQASRRVTSLAAGVRYQLANGLVLGAEGTWGWTDGNLELDEPAQNTHIEYGNDTQFSLGALIGYAFQSSMPVLIFAYASEVTRQFDVSVTQGGSAFTQRDEQGQLRYGLGVEVNLREHLELRLRLGSGRSDFGDALTNITPQRRLQYGIGLVYQF